MNKEKQRQLKEWILIYLPEKNDLQGTLELQALASDAGFRRYYRLNTTPSMIAVYSPPNKENNLAYVEISLALNARDIRRPHLYAVDFSRGFLLLEDLGEQLLLPLLSAETVENLYGQAELMLQSIQKSEPNTEIFPTYDTTALTQEFDLFATWFVKKMLGVSIDEQTNSMLNTLSTDLSNNAISQPQVIVHRDYHSRNLMLMGDQQLAVIDFQDAVIGPITYDLVSLLKDCYVSWPRELVERRALNYRQQLEDSELMVGVDEQTFLRWFDLMGLQRHIKVMGVFARLALRDGKTEYLHDLPLVIAYVLDVVSRYPAAAPFGRWFDAEVKPHLSSQSWYKGSHQFFSADLADRDTL